MENFKIISKGVVSLGGYLWIQSEDYPPNCKESITVYGNTYYKTQKIK